MKYILRNENIVHQQICEIKKKLHHVLLKVTKVIVGGYWWAADLCLANANATLMRIVMSSWSKCWQQEEWRCVWVCVWGGGGVHCGHIFLCFYLLFTQSLEETPFYNLLCRLFLCWTRNSLNVNCDCFRRHFWFFYSDIIYSIFTVFLPPSEIKLSQ